MITFLEPEPKEVLEKPAGQVDLALVTVTQQIAEFSALDAGFAELEKRHKDVVYDVSTTKGMDEAKKARMEVRQVRFNAQNLLKATKEPLNKLKADLDETAGKIIARISAVEDPIDAQVKAQEDKKAAEKAAAELAEQELAATIQAAINAFTYDPRIALSTPEVIQAEIARIGDIEVSLEVFGKRAGEALLAQQASIEVLLGLHKSAVDAEVAQQLLAEQRHQLAQAQAALESERAAIAVERAAAAAKVEAEATAARVKAEAEAAELRRQEKAIRDEEDRVENEARAAEQKRLDDIAAADRKRLDDIAAAERAEADRIANEARIEAERVANVNRLFLEKTAAADKRLRDAAPQLLSALRGVMASVAGCQQEEIYQAARAAIQQATGEEA